MKVSVLILACNEAINLPGCLCALSWCDDIVVVDSGSTDRTVAIATEYGARVLNRPFDSFAGQRNFGLDEGLLRHEWVLHLDADEIVTTAFARAVASLEPIADLDAWRVPLKIMFFGRWLRRAGMWPTYQVRLGHVRRLRFIQVGHGQRESLPRNRVGTFPEALLHYSFSHGLRSWLTKHLRYAQDEARLIVERPHAKICFAKELLSRDRTVRRRAAKNFSAILPPFVRPPARFLYVYILRRGFLDGAPGFVFAFMLAVYEAMTAILVYEMKKTDSSNSIPAIRFE